MTGCEPFVLLGTSTFAQLCAGWAAVLPIGALAIHGWYRGAFLATITGLQIVGSFVAALALALPVSGILESLGCPAAQAPATAYALVFGVGVLAVRMLVGATVPDGAFRLAPLIDQFAGVVLGAASGLALGGALLVGWSMADVPAWTRLDNTHQPLDSGTRMLRTFARIAGRGPGGPGLLLEGDRPARAGDAGVVSASEPFADIDGDGRRDGGADAGPDAEPYLDVDRDGAFTATLEWFDSDGDGRWTAGLRDCYRLADWRRIRVLHAPVIESAAEAEVLENSPPEEPVYAARARDADGDAITYALERVADADAGTEPEAGSAPDVVIDPATGVVTLAEPADFERTKWISFVVVATDATGLAARKTVRVRVRDVLLEPAP